MPPRRRLASQVEGRALDDNAVFRLFHETEGNPLFVVETVRAGIGLPATDGRARMAAADDGYALPPRLCHPRPGGSPRLSGVVASRRRARGRDWAGVQP
ncbi:MAG: hypothetical protein U0641_09245 [Anaerolineae bacterium]